MGVCAIAAVRKSKREAQMESWNAVIAHENLASTLYSWHAALHAINKSSDVGIYNSAAEEVVEHLCMCKTLDELLCAYSSGPDLTLLRATLCTQGDIPLRPHRLLAASCALRLRELIGAAGG